MASINKEYYLKGASDFFKTAELHPGIGREPIADILKELKELNPEFIFDPEHAARLQGQHGHKLKSFTDYDVLANELFLEREIAALERKKKRLRGKLHERAGEIADLKLNQTKSDKALKKVKLHRAGLGALAALGLGYIGYDQLSDSGVPKAFAPTQPTQPLGPPRSV